MRAMSEGSDTNPTAAIILIGNELLSGKVTDENGKYLIGELRALGVEVRELRIIPDQLETIAKTVRALSAAVTHLFTTGGVGPTHDDVTLAGVAAAFGVELVENATMAHHIEQVFADNPDRCRAFMKLALVPEGTTLLQSSELLWPVYRVENVYILPGVPEIFRRQFDSVRDRFHSDPFYLSTIYFTIDEGQLAPGLNEACRRFPGITFGSYPVWKNSDYRVRVTIESKQRASVESARRWLVSHFRGDAIYKIVDGLA